MSFKNIIKKIHKGFVDIWDKGWNLFILFNSIYYTLKYIYIYCLYIGQHGVKLVKYKFRQKSTSFCL